jgi:hypothetical protein
MLGTQALDMPAAAAPAAYWCGICSDAASRLPFCLLLLPQTLLVFVFK